MMENGLPRWISYEIRLAMTICEFEHTLSAVIASEMKCSAAIQYRVTGISKISRLHSAAVFPPGFLRPAMTLEGVVLQWMGRHSKAPSSDAAIH